MSANDIAFLALMELTTCSHAYHETIRSAIKSVAKRNEIELTEEMITEAFIIICKTLPKLGFKETKHDILE